MDKASRFNTGNTETEDHIKQHQENALSKIQTVQNSTRQPIFFNR